VYFDNYFTTLPLLEKLTADGFLAAGTIRKGRIAKAKLADEKDLRKKGRWSWDEVSDIEKGLVLVRWFDNSAVNMASNYCGAGAGGVVKRWSNEKKEKVDVKRPDVIGHYNHNMGGVDKLDHLVALYQIEIKMKKWTSVTFRALEQNYRSTAEV
jgi:DNA excision repair protein ERCC-6